MALDKRLYKRAAVGFALANLAVFIIYFLFAHFEGVADTAFGEIVNLFILPFVMRGIDLLIPLSAAVILLIISVYDGMRAALIRGIFIALTRFLYLFPYYYLYFVYDGYDSIESCMHSAIWSIVGCVALYAVIALCFLVMHFIFRKRAGERDLCDCVGEGGIFSLDKPFCFTLLCASFGGFAFLLTREITSSSISVFSNDTVIRFSNDPADWLVTSTPRKAVKSRLCIVS